MAFEDLTGFTESDPGADITVTTTKVDVVGADSRQTKSYVYKDYGAGNFGDLHHRFTMNYASGSNFASGQFWMMTNTAAQSWKEAQTANVGQAVYIYRDGSGNRFFGLYDAQNDNDDSYAASGNGTFYMDVVRSGTSLTLKIYSDSAYTTLLDTVVITCNTTTWRYFSCWASEESGFGAGVVITGYGENYDFNPATSTQPPRTMHQFRTRRQYRPAGMESRMFFNSQRRTFRPSDRLALQYQRKEIRRAA